MSIGIGQFRPLLDRISEELQRQYWSSSTLYIVATPIGNLCDMTWRAIYTLQLVDVIACEDTRSSRTLLNSYGITTPLMAAHQHNEVEAAHQIIQRLQEGQRVALISDAGSPAVSDPGGRLVALVKEAGFEVRPIPGASAVITAVMGSGITNDANPGFTFAGFIPPKSHARQQWLQQWLHSRLAVVMFESPYRIVDSIQDMINIYGTQRTVVLARELTKRFEQIVTLSVGDLLDWLQVDTHRQKGEFVLILSPFIELREEEENQQELDRLLTVMLEHISLKDAVKITTQLTQLPKDRVYSRALVLKEQSQAIS